MFSSFFSTAAPVDPTAPNFHPVSSRYPAKELFGALEPKDTEWTCAGGFVTETQTFYTITEDGTSLMCQVIHSAVGLWYPTIQFTCKIHNSKTGETTWKSINVTNFVTPPPGLDKRSSKGDQFSITYKSKPGTQYPESYMIFANLAEDLQVSLEVQRPAETVGYKIGNGAQGGFSYFGPDIEKPEGYVVHRFWPRYVSSGHIINNGKAETVQGPGMFVHAIQGMRPNLVASRWNFAHFQSSQFGGVSAIQMEFKTLDTHGPKGAGSGGVVVNVGSLVVGGKLVCVTAESKSPEEEQQADAEVVSRASHLNPERDPDTDYDKPNELLFQWTGPSLIKEAAGVVKGEMRIDVGGVEAPRGLIEKVDVLAEIPYVLKMAVNYVAGTKPYIYQWMNPISVKITGPEEIHPGLSQGISAEGWVYNEATFIS
ncbi:hypothetical protein AMATHDRAFT_73812 [Amanita thiersii Skay4041]|uniref:Svf1-like C-terminal domain-containing protein n=1 Tax=Amanita thiersii Skay4041 TaxID=703135 RepID=A0A2A9NR30_9AGAR|nr:hypothetical protein AMATHDRAFT_73812 [Amanita thiersii Skay4041]